MSEEETPPDVGQAPVTTVPASLVSADGSLVDGWQQHAPEGYEDLKEDKTLSTLKNVWALGKSYVHVRKQVPMDKMPRPNENWGDSDWDEFHTAGGRPDTAGDYGIKRNEAIPEEVVSQEMLDGFQELFHKIGLSKKQSDALVAYNDEQTLKAMNGAKDAETELNTRLWDTLHDKWGRAYDQKVFRGTKAIERGTGGDEGFYQRVLDKANKDADLIEFMANMEDKFSEHEPVEMQNIDTPADLQSQINEIRKNPLWLKGDKNQRQPLIDKVNRLTEQKLKDQGITD